MSARLFLCCVLMASAWSVGAEPASNDSPGSPKTDFKDGMFLLPELESVEDSYLVIVKPSDDSPKVRFTLPPGSTGLRVATAALPKVAWTWEYKVSRQKVPKIEIAAADVNQTLLLRDLVEGKRSLFWPPVKGAKKYVLSGETKTKSAPAGQLEVGKLEASCFHSVCARGELATKAIELKPGMEVQWQVAALDEDGFLLAKSDPAQIRVEDSWVQTATQSGWKLQRSDTLSTKTATLPATFSYISNQKDGATSRERAYQSEFAVIYEAPESWGDFWPKVSMEGKLTSSGAEKPKDAFKFRAGGYQMIAGSKSGEGTEFVANLKYETERKTGTKKGLVEIGFTPIYGGLGRLWPGPPKRGQADAAGNYIRLPWLQVMPIVSFGAELGKTMDVGTSEETSKTIVRLRTNLRLDVELNALASGMGLRSVTAYADGTYWHLPKEDDVRNYRLGKTGLNFGLTDVVSLDFAYTVGREAPDFKFVRTGTAGFGLKF